MKRECDDQTRQLIVVTASGWDAHSGFLRRFEWERHWRAVGAPWPVSLGSGGLAWGRGLHTASSEGPTKKEGDGAAPAGIFKIGPAFGYNPEPPDGVTWPYTQVDRGWRCVDDPASRHYNQVIQAADMSNPDWRSAEEMRREDDLYRLTLFIAHNHPRVLAGAGSCIFLHIWQAPGAPTEGCTAMSEKNMVELLRWLKPNAEPRFVQLPEEAIPVFRAAWDLPGQMS